MPKAPRIRKSKGNKCNYCYNHRNPDDPIVMAAGHGRCPYNNKEHFEKCQECLKNHGHTSRMETYRRNKRNECETVIEILVLRPEEEQLREADVGEQEIADVPMSSQQDLATQPPNQSDSNDLTLAGFPLDFPEYIFNDEDVKNFEILFEKMILEMPKTKQIPKFKSSSYEAGFWKVVCMNEYSKNWFIENASKVTFSFIENIEETLQVKPIKELPKYEFAVQMSGKILEDYQYIKYFEHYNRDIELNASRWDNLECIPNKDGYVLCLEIDPISFEKIKDNEFELSFGMQRVTFKTLIK